MDPSIPTVHITLWRADAVVLFDWLAHVDVDAVPIVHPAQKQALVDLLGRLEQDTDVMESTVAEIRTAQDEVAKDMGW